MIHVEKPKGLYIPCPNCYDGYLKKDKYSGIYYCVCCKTEFKFS